jgi:MIP family channel proteins
MHDRTRATIAEAVGTFALVFIGAGSICLNEYTGHALGLLGIAISQGLILSVAVTATAAISGGHLNPAVTFGFFIIGKMGRDLALRYAGAQLLGATLAAFSLRWIFAEHVWRPALLGTPDLAPDLTTIPGIFLEAILTFLLVFAFWGTLVDERAPRIGGFGIGLTLCSAILMGGPLTGAALNPARAFGPALASAHWGSHLVYWLGPLLGGGAAAFFYNNFLMKDQGGGGSGALH